MLEKEIEEIILKEEDIVPLLKRLTLEERRDLVPFLKKFRNLIYQTYDVKKQTKWGLSVQTKNTYSLEKRTLIDKACYVCFNKTEVKKILWSASSLSVSDDFLENIIPWYTPKWFSEIINDDIPWGLTYSKALQLYQDGLLQLSHGLILNKLPNAIIDHERKDNKLVRFYNPDNLLQYEVTLEEHIWHLFEEESSINNFYDYLNLENYSDGNDVWIDTILNLVQNQKLDRKKVLIATIYTSTKGFNKNLSGWFFDLLIKLNPSNDEILDLQEEFLSALNSPHSKVVNTILKYFKSVATQKKFKYNVFVENASMLLNSETKSVVNSTLMILDKIAKSQKAAEVSVSKKVAEALISNDEKIQVRAAKIIDKYGKSIKDELADDINLYAGNLLHSTKEILKDYIDTNEEVWEDEIGGEEIKFLTEDNKLPTFTSVDELIFFVSQAIDNNEVYHIDLLLAYLPKLNALLNEDNVANLEPIFKRAFDLAMSYDWSGQIGILETDAARYINDFAEILLQKYPSELSNFRKTKDKKIKNLDDNSYYKEHYNNSLRKIENQTVPDHIYFIHRHLFIKSKTHIKKGLTLDLLSTPTHAPCWIDPFVLIDRIVAYEQHNENIDLYDFQIAVGRLPINEQGSDINTKINEIGDESIKKVLQYQFDLIDIQSLEIKRADLWIQSILSKNNASDIKYFQELTQNDLKSERGIYRWTCTPSDHFYMDYDYSTREKVQKKFVRRELKFKDFDIPKKNIESLTSGLKDIFKRKKKKVKVRSIYENMFFAKQKYYSIIRPHDDVKFLFLSPNNPSMYLSHVIHSVMGESTFSEETGKRNMINILKGLYDIWNRIDYRETTYLLLATGLLCSDKVARTLAAELWIKANTAKVMDNAQLGRILGKLEYGEYAPMKRFTDLITSQMFNISKAHNESLYNLFDQMIGNMNTTPIRGVKKLLEIFLELKYNISQPHISAPTRQMLLEWKEIKSLSSVIKKIEK